MHTSHLVKSAAGCVLLCDPTGFVRVGLGRLDALSWCSFFTWKHHCDLTGFVRVGWVNLSRFGVKSMRDGVLEACDRHNVVTDLRYSSMNVRKKV